MKANRLQLFSVSEMLWVLLTVMASDAIDDPCIVSPSSCGHLPQITYPFRLTTDPIGCGHSSYQITCETNVPTIFDGSRKFIVRSINYNNYTIRVSDASFIPTSNHAFFCNSSASLDLFYSDYIRLEKFSATFDSPEGPLKTRVYPSELILFSCPTQLPGSSFARFEGDRICENDVYNLTRDSLHSRVDNHYWYVNSTLDTYDDLEESCRLELGIYTSLSPFAKDRVSFSFKDVKDAVDYGLELSWFEEACIYAISSHENPCSYLYHVHITTAEYLERFHHDRPLRHDSLLRLLARIGRTPIIAYMFKKFQWDAPENGLQLLNIDYFVAAYRYTLIICGFYKILLLGVMSPLLVVLLVDRLKKRHLSVYDNIEEFLQSFGELIPVRYSYSDIKKMTNNFDEKLGEGGFGAVYKGELRSGNFAAVKVLGRRKGDNTKDFINDVATIGRARHVNIVRLVGFCSERSKRALVYEFMANGSLDKYIKSEGPSEEHKPHISCKKMYQIATGIARGIEYLHHGCAVQILHFDLKPHNILLDENFDPKISDFGLAKLHPTDKSMVSVTATRGTLGYMAPEFFYSNVGRVSHKADVYSYGRMVMEMAAGKRYWSGSSCSSGMFLPAWVHDQLAHGREFDFRNVDEEGKEMMKKMMMVGLWCVQLNPEDRPSMHKVVAMIKGDVADIGLPQKPSFAPPLRLPMPINSFTQITSEGEDIC